MTAKDNTIKPKFKKCKICKSKFQLFRTTQKVCSPNCAIELAKVDGAKKEKKSHSAAKRKLKDEDRSFQLKKTQTIFNKYIRLRDSGKPCISCYRVHSGQNHAGHYRSVGSCPELRFDPRNCYRQCAPCNNHLSGNIIPYRSNLVASFGQGLVEFLEGPHRPKRYTIAQLKTIQKWFKRKTKRMERDHV